jgi:hypothetical protein
LIIQNIRGIATDIGVYYSAVLTTYSATGVKLSNTDVALGSTYISGSQLFTNGIRGVREHVQQVFSLTSSALERPTDDPHAKTLTKESTIDAKWGVGTEANLDNLGDSILAGMSGKNIYLLIWLALIFLAAFLLFTTGSPTLAGVGAIVTAVCGAWMGADLWIILGIGGMVLAFMVMFDYLRSG